MAGLLKRYRCLSCGAVYSDTMPDGSHYAHACHPEVIEHAEFDADGKLVKEEKRAPRQDARNENPAAGMFFLEGKPMRRVAHREEPGVFTAVPMDYAIISEGKGREAVDG